VRKIIVVILALVYISSSTGAMLHLHYCMGKIVDWDLGQKKSKICSGCGMKKDDRANNRCCKDEHKFIKNVTDQKITESGFQLIRLISEVFPTSFDEILHNNFSTLKEENPISHAPPRSSGVAVYVRNCVFLI